MNKIVSGGVVGVFGLPCSGKSTLIEIVKTSSREILASVSSGDIARELSTQKEIQHMAAGNLFPYEEPLRTRILETVNKRRAGGAERIFLDGVPRTVLQIEWMLENQLLGHDSGCLVQVVGDKLFERANIRARDDQDSARALQAKIDRQRVEISSMEYAIQKFGISYYTVMNYDLAIAAQTFSKFIGLRK